MGVKVGEAVGLRDGVTEGDCDGFDEGASEGEQLGVVGRLDIGKDGKGDGILDG